MYKKLTAGSVKSVADIRRLLQIDSVDEEENVYESAKNGTRRPLGGNSSHSRVIRSIDAEVAMIAQCKTRTEVFEITRQLVDPTNANFLVQPPCVEVQRCSGCCYSPSIKCVPVRTRIRYVQVKKIVIQRSKKTTILVPIPLEDHVECSCQSVSPLSVRSQHHHHEHRRVADVTVTTPPPPPVTRKEEPLPRHLKRKNRKFKHLPSKKEQRDLLAT
ncbi:platelet-derived growth factor subunit B isoform X2 [Pseudophryne corroboree]